MRQFDARTLTIGVLLGACGTMAVGAIPMADRNLVLSERYDVSVVHDAAEGGPPKPSIYVLDRHTNKVYRHRAGDADGEVVLTIDEPKK